MAIAARKGIDRHLLKSISDDDPVWDSVAHALGSLCATLVLMVSVERIVISGGVLNRKILYPKIRVRLYICVAVVRVYTAGVGGDGGGILSSRR